MRSPSRLGSCAMILALCACASVQRDPWVHAGVVFQDGDVVARIQSKRSAAGVSLSWIGVRSEGERQLRAVRLVVFDDVNGDLEAQAEELLTRWETRSAEPQSEFSVKASFVAENMKPDVLARLMVLTEVTYFGDDREVASETRPLP